MKKFLIMLCMVLIFMPASLFAQPSEKEVADSIEGVMAVFAQTMLLSMMGMPPNEYVSYNETKTGLQIKYTNYDAKAVMESLKALSTADKADVIPFKMISGVIEFDGDLMGGKDPERIFIDVSLKGGPVHTLKAEFKAKKNAQAKKNAKTDMTGTIKANGHTYAHPENIIKILDE